MPSGLHYTAPLVVRVTGGSNTVGPPYTVPFVHVQLVRAVPMSNEGGIHIPFVPSLMVVDAAERPPSDHIR